MKQKTRKLANRSGIEKCEICGEQTFLETHHINGREILNANNDFNLTTICPNCHFEVHLGETILEGRFMSTNGNILIWRKKNEQTLTGNSCTPPLIKTKP